MSRTPRLHVPALPAAGCARLPEEEARHLVRVLRARPGDAVRAFDGRGREVEAVVVVVDRDGAEVEIRGEVAAPRPIREVVLVTAAPRGERMEWLVEKATEAGVARIVPLAAERSVRKEAGPSSLRRWRRAAVEAAKQCGRATVPDVAEPTTLVEALTSTPADARFIATPGAAARLPDLVAAAPRVAVFVGPEGGFDLDETAALAQAGARAYGLGGLILRVETAAVLSVFQASS
jgi:16S rRNA (uracil1498-N3)-methyltransferase